MCVIVEMFVLIFGIAKADELPVHNRKGVGNQQEKGGGVL